MSADKKTRPDPIALKLRNDCECNMRISLLLKTIGFLIFWFQCVQVQAAPSLFYDYEYSQKSRSVEIRDIKGIVELSSLSEGCMPAIISGSIESVDYVNKSTETPESFRLRTPSGFVEWIGLNSVRSASFSMIDLTWVGKFFAPGRKVLVVGMRCGASGHEFVARDIYDAKFVGSTLGVSKK